MSCMLCKKSGVIINVATNYGKINHTVVDAFNEIYGDKIEPYLTPDRSICNVCMNVLDNVAKLRRTVWSLVTDPNSHQQPNQLGKFWKIFAALKLQDDIEPVQSQETRTPTPNLVFNSHSVPFNAILEKQIEEEQRRKSLNITKNKRYKSPKPPVGNDEENEKDSEKDEKTNRRRRKKGHRWTRKKGAYKTARSISYASSGCGRSITNTPFSDSSLRTRFRSRSRSRSRCTRSVSRLEQEEAKNSSSSYLVCTEKNCNMFSDSIEEMNQHNIEEHAMYNSFFCHECLDVYTTKSLYNLHKKYHNFSFYCLMCGVEQKNSFELQQHLDEHMLYSVPCKCCDKSFLSKRTRDEHMKECNKSRRKRRVSITRLILDRIDKTEEDGEQGVEDEVDFGPRYLLYTDIDPEEGDIEMTVENLEMKNIPIYREEDEGMTSEEFSFQQSQTVSTPGIEEEPCLQPVEETVDNVDRRQSIVEIVESIIESFEG